MSTLTKVFVVLTLVLSIGYCVAAALLFAYSHDYRMKYEAEQADHQETRDEKNQEIADLNSKVEGYEKQIDALEADREKLKRDNSELEKDLDEKQHAFDDLDRTYKTLNDAHMTLTRTVGDLEDRLAGQQDKIDDLQTRLTEIDDEKNKLAMELTTLKDDKDRLEDKLVATRKELHDNEEKRKEYEDVLARLEKMGVNIPEIIVRAEPVHGQILAVDPETDIVVISIGANAHVTKGMKLSVYREDKFVGSIKVISVFPDMSSARILRELTRREVQPGDNVTNRF